MGRLRKDYLTRQRSTPFQCLTYMFMHRHYFLWRRLFLTLLLADGQGREPSCDRADLHPVATTSHLCQCPHTGEHTHCVPPHSFLQPFPSKAGRSSLHISTRSYCLLLWQIVWSLPVLLSYKQPCWGSWTQKYHTWPIFLLATYSFLCFPWCLKRWAASPFASHSVNICRWWF